MTVVTPRKSIEELPERLRHDADTGPVITPAGYTVLSRADWERLLKLIEDELDEREFKIAWERRQRGGDVVATLDEMREKYGL